ncbi:MAG: bifunctional folylpolyglutamate synthase/dihydrofolate synthase [Paludibacteraceae bacterium]|nr:bifunctional folylpolyglutamate synthase/dihydrofolate synthase [Paludibacteraceae bacterium]
MTYQEALRYLYDAAPAFHLVGAAAYKPGLDNVLALMAQFGNPHTKFHSIHVAGTNGKGSTSHLIAAVLQAAGYKVGLYTSPHLVDFRERIRINGQPIPQQEVVDFVEKIRNPQSPISRINPSFFEITMALAFDYFAQQQIDIAVVEVGLGGRLDSTNIITPLLSVITNIGFDHTEFLGNTLADIAREKAGIIKPNVPCVIGETDPETAPVFIEAAKRNGIYGEGLETTDCRIWFADQCGYLRKRRKNDVKECQLKGIYQEHNQQTAYVALQVLRNYTNHPLRITPSAIANGYAHVCTLTGLRGRWETLCEKPLTICDTGHNSHGIKYVAEQLQQYQISNLQSQIHIVFGMVNDKDVDVVLKLMPKDAHYYFTQAQTHRAIPAKDLAQLFGSGDVFSDVPSAVRAAQKNATDKDIIFIGGSNYVVGEALTLF